MKVNLKLIIAVVVILAISAIEYYFFDKNILISLLRSTVIYTIAYFGNKKYG